MRWIMAALAVTAALSPAAAQRAPNGRPYLSQPLVSDIFTADPAAHVFDGRIYVYASHDVTGPALSDAPPFQKSEGNSFRMTDFLVLSMDRPGGAVTVHRNILDITDVPWAARQMWARIAQEFDGFMKGNAMTQISVLDARDQADRLTALVREEERRTGRRPGSLAELEAVRAGRVQAVDSSGVPFEYDAGTGTVSVSQRSTLWRKH